MSRVRVPCGDIEVDVDMESAEDGVYLRGALVSAVPPRATAAGGYHPFCTWQPLTGAVEAELFAQFWAWLTGLRRDAAAGSRPRAVRAGASRAGLIPRNPDGRAA